MTDIPTQHHPVYSDYPYNTPGVYKSHWCRTVSWSAIFAGLVAALACDIVLMMLSAGLGFAIYAPISDQNPVEHFSTGAIIITGFSAVVALWFGGWIAGRLTPLIVRGTGCLHGLIVWCAATVAGVIFLSVGAGWALGDLSKLVGGGLSAAGKPAAAVVSGATNLVKDAAQSTKDSLASFTDEAIGARGANSDASTTIRAKREIGLAVARLFNPAQQANTSANRSALITVLVDNAGMSQSNAERLVNDWTTSYEQLKADLAAVKEQAAMKAREAANEASKALAVFSLCAFFGFLLGAIAACCGGCAGAKLATKRDEARGLVYPTRVEPDPRRSPRV